MRSGAEFFFVVHDAVIYIFSFTADLIVISFNKINEMRLVSVFFCVQFVRARVLYGGQYESKNLTVRSWKKIGRFWIRTCPYSTFSQG